MRERAPGNFKAIEKLKKLPATTLGAITTDYMVIVWWANAMTDMGKSLEDVRQFFKDNPKPDPENNTFKSLRRKLSSKLKEVAATTKEEFGDPWGLVVMDQLSRRQADAKAQLTGPVVAISRERG